MEQEAICPAGKIIITQYLSSDLQEMDRLDIGYPPFEWPLEADDEDEDDVGGDPKDAEAGQQEGGHLLVLRAQEPGLSGERHRYILNFYGINYTAKRSNNYLWRGYLTVPNIYPLLPEKLLQLFRVRQNT